MLKSRARVRLHDILTEIGGIRQLTAGLDLAQFDSSWAIQRATQHGLLIISEAVRNLPSEVRDRRPDIPWEKIRSLGNFLRHAYQQVDNETLWVIVQDRLPELEAAVRELVAGLEENSG